MENVGSTTCFHFCANPLSGVFQIRLNTGPVIRVWKSKSRRPIGSLTCTFWASRLSLQYVPRQLTIELNVRNGQRVNGIRSVGFTSTRVSPWSAVITEFVVLLRSRVTYSLFTPK